MVTQSVEYFSSERDTWARETRELFGIHIILHTILHVTAVYPCI